MSFGSQERGLEAGMKGQSPQHTYFAYKLCFGGFCTNGLQKISSAAMWIFPQLKRLSPVGTLDPTPTRQGTALHPETTLPARKKRGPLWPHLALLCATVLEALLKQPPQAGLGVRGSMSGHKMWTQMTPMDEWTEGNFSHLNKW